MKRILQFLGWYEWHEAWPLSRWPDGRLTGFRAFKGRFQNWNDAVAQAHGEECSVITRWLRVKP